MKINLTELANQVNERYKEVECSFGTVRVYHVPEPHIWTYRPDWFPSSVPKKEMELANGQIQVKPVRNDSPEYKAWEAEQKRWEQETEDIQLAARYAIALRDVEYPANLSVPPPSLRDYLNGHYPDNELLRKKIWLDATILARTSDLLAIQQAIMELGNMQTVNAKDVDNVKKNSESDSEVTDLKASKSKAAAKIQ